MTTSRVAVVGGGIFGISSALELAKLGFEVDLFERNRDLLVEASSMNQCRLHRGYHYPRSDETALQSKRAEPSFREAYAEAVVGTNDHHYAIARSGSLTTAARYLEFLQRHELEHEVVEVSLLDPQSIDLCIRAREALIDTDALKRIVWSRLRDLGVTVHTSHAATPETTRDHDFTVLATYSSLNDFIGGSRLPQTPYQFEVCEIAVVRLPDQFTGKSVVVMDGPYMCFDPFGRSDRFLWYDVRHSVHAMNVGRLPIVPERLSAYLNAGTVDASDVSHFSALVESGRRFLPGVRDAEYIGSNFTVRAVLPNLDSSDARLSHVQRLGPKLATVFSGKICTSVEAARTIGEMVSHALGVRSIPVAGADRVAAR